jgi:hypothetical protein
MLNQFEHIRKRLTPLRSTILDHPIYEEIDRLPALRLFMEHHVFAVWDFMSLLKALQRLLCCVEVPWLPADDAAASRFVNEIVLAEESDDDGQGGFASHFELYHRAMTQCGANTAPIDGFLREIRQGKAVSVALESVGAAECVRRFVGKTFDLIDEGTVCAIASAFTFGREDLLPAIFRRVVDELNVKAGGELKDFKYYLERHIDVDGEEHGPMANRLLQSLCGSDELYWQLAEHAAMDCLAARRELWDGIYDLVRREEAIS